MQIIYWRYQGFDPNDTPAYGFAIKVGILHASGQTDETQVNFVEPVTDQDIEDACAAAVVARTASEYPLVDIAGTRRLP